LGSPTLEKRIDFKASSPPSPTHFSQFTGSAFTGALIDNAIAISMDGLNHLSKPDK
jgi:hypothetical protein